MAQAVNDDEECPNVPLGTVVIGYKVGRLLGSGAYSSVHLGVHQETKARVALKFLSDSDDYRRTQALTEVKFLKELASVPNVIKLIAIDHWQKCSVLVLPLIGADLDQLRPSGVAFNRGTLLKIGIDLISTIEQVHKLGICHRSIKSPNICMRDLGNPKSPLLLIDFGMAVKLETKRGRVVPYKEIANDTYHLRSYAPLNEIEPNSWTFTDDLVMLAYMLIRMNNDTASYQGDSVSETARRKKALIKDPRANLSNQSRFLAPFLKMVHSQGWRSLPKYAALRLVLSAAATKAAPISKLWSFRREEGKVYLN